MSGQQSAEEVEAEHIAKLGPDLGPVYHALWNECAWLNVKWQQYQVLFGTSPEHIELLNHVAPVFFRVVQDTLWEGILLAMCALTDPLRSVGKANLTVYRLSELTKESDPNFREELTEDIKAAREATEFARDWRNRHIAHHDLALAVDAGAKPLEPASRKRVSAAINAVCNVLRKISLQYLESDIVFGAFREPGGAQALLCVLRDGLGVGESLD